MKFDNTIVWTFTSKRRRNSCSCSSTHGKIEKVSEDGTTVIVTKVLPNGEKRQTKVLATSVYVQYKFPAACSSSCVSDTQVTTQERMELLLG